MSTVTTSNLSADLLPGLQKLFGQYNQWPENYKMYFDVQSTSERYAKDVVMRGAGMAAELPEGQAFDLDTISLGPTKTYTQIVYGTGFKITEEAMEDGHVMDVAKECVAEGKKAIVQTREQVCANVLNRAFNSSYTGYDGIEMCGSHVLYGYGNISNKPSAACDMSEAAFEQACIDIYNFKDERGLMAMVKPVKLITRQENEFIAERILGSDGRVETPNNDLNALKSLGKLERSPLIIPHMTDTDAWFVLTNADKGLRYLEKRPMRMVEDSDKRGRASIYTMDIRFAASWTDWRGIYGSQGA